MPLLDEQEVSSLLAHPTLKDLKQQLIDKVSFWHDIALISEQSSLTDGELFFYASDGYFLQK